MEEKDVKLNKKQSSKRKKKFNFSKLLKRVPFTLKMIVVIIIALLVFILGTKIPSKPDSKETLINFGFKDVGELVTQEWYGRVIEDSSKDRKLFNSISIPFTESRLIFSIDVEVLAAVNFENIEYEISDKKVIVTLPHSEVYKAYEVQNSFISYLDEESWFTNINATEQQNLKDKIVETAKDQAIESGVLSKADENAKSIIKNVVKANEATKNFEVEFEYK